MANKCTNFTAFLAGFGLVYLTLVTAGCRSTPLPDLEADNTNTDIVSERVLLIKHGWDMPTIAWASAHENILSAAPFDGVILDSPLRDRVFSRIPLEKDATYSAVAPYRQVESRSRSDFLLMLTSHPKLGNAPPSVEGDWTVVVENIALTARAAQSAGFYGIAIDPEPYGKNWLSGPPTESKVAAAKARGREIASALGTAWPNLQLLILQGPYAAVNTDGSYRKRWPLLGPFLAGLMLSDPRIHAIDGGQAYGLSELKQFKEAVIDLKNKWPSRYPWLTADEHMSYASEISLGFGVYDREWLQTGGGPPLKKPALLHKLENAMKSAERIVWLYSEAYDWWHEKPVYPMLPVPPEMVEALSNLRTQPLVVSTI